MNKKIGRLFFCFLLAFAAALASLQAQAATTTLLPAGSTWRYLDNGTNQGTAWRAPSFDDTAWASGAAQLGYGDGDESTVVSFGTNANAKYVTTYLRRHFQVTDRAAFTSLKLRLLRDDGAVVYLNGVEVFRSNMPAGAVGYTTLATTALGAPDESTFVETALQTTQLLTGDNLLAVEVHQANGTSTDLSFDLELLGADGISVTRGPYLQSARETAVLVRWRTDASTDSEVRFGTQSGNLGTVASDATLTTEHQVLLTSLSANTRYFYSVGASAGPLKSGTDLFFVTPPAAGAAKPTRIWVLGDSGTADANARAVRDAYMAYTGSRYTDMILMLGDNAYDTGTDAEYQAAVFGMYPTTLAQSVLWPTLGNHDTAQSASPSVATLPYFQMFTLPTAAEAGGVASGTEKYYSFDFGDIHFICLDSMTSDRSTNGPMLSWLASDLANNMRRWTVAFWHHPPYSKGSHDSDTETNLIQMRANALPILESYGVDLVLSGHSHSYERSYLLDGHYGSSTTLTSAMKLNAGSGRADGSGIYRKTSSGSAGHEGAVYGVAGSSGQTSGGTLNHPAMYLSLNQLGSLVIDVDGARLDARFINSSGVVADYFTVTKGIANQAPSVAMTAPTAGASTSAPGTFTLSASASDADGVVKEVSFFANGTLVGTDLAAPYSIVWTSIPAGSYSITARATDNENTSTTSGSLGVTVLSGPPAAPSKLSATALTGRQIRIGWTDNATNETGFEIQQATNNTFSSGLTTTTVGENVKTFTATGLATATTYYYRVRSTNAAGSSAWSNTAKATAKK